MVKKILLVDDDVDLIKILSLRLKAHHYDVVVARDGMQAVQAAHRERPDLIILDFMMPAGSGISVYDKLQKSTHTSQIPVIFITASADGEIQKNIMEMGAEAVITKPFEMEILLGKIW
jgi:DNA-binding response OmpR family regulator